MSYSRSKRILQKDKHYKYKPNNTKQTWTNRKLLSDVMSYVVMIQSACVDLIEGAHFTKYQNKSLKEAK